MKTMDIVNHKTIGIRGFDMYCCEPHVYHQKNGISTIFVAIMQLATIVLILINFWSMTLLTN